MTSPLAGAAASRARHRARRRARPAARLAFLAAWTAAAATGAARAGDPFGFAGLEIFPASTESVAVRPADMDRDGTIDLVFAYNSDTSIRILLQGAGAAPEAEAAPDDGRGSLNRPIFDRRFRSERIYTEKRVLSLDVGDLDSDGRSDIAYYGDPAELIVVYQGDDWTSRQTKISIDDGARTPGALRVVDVDGDGKQDIALLGKGKTYILRQRADGTLAPAETLFNISQEAQELFVVDIDGDGHRDLATVTARSEHPVSVRFQRDGSFGAERRSAMPLVQRALLANYDGAGGAELLVVQGNTRRVLAYRWGAGKRAAGEPLGEPRWVAFRPGADVRNRRVAFGDVTGDGRVDLLVTYGELAEADVHAGAAGGEFLRPVASPVLADVRSILIGDLAGDGAPRVLLLSNKEKTLGLCRWLPAGRLDVPRVYPVEGEPLVLGAAELTDEARGRLALGGRRAFFLVSRAVPGSEPYTLDLAALEGDHELRRIARVGFQAGGHPPAVQSVDLRGDGLPGALVFVPYDNPRLYPLTAGAEGQPWTLGADLAAASTFGITPLARLNPEAVTVTRLPLGDGAGSRDDLLVASGSHVRALRASAAGRLETIEQISTGKASAEVSHALAVQLDDDADLEVIAFDKTSGGGALDVFDRDASSLYRRIHSMALSGLKPQRLEAVDLDGDGAAEIALVSETAVGLIGRAGGAAFASDGFSEAACFDPGAGEIGDQAALRHGLPDLLAVGDLNADGAADLILATSPSPHLAFLPLAGGASELTPDLRFRIFEEKSYMRLGGTHGPREMAVADLTGDGRNDLILLIHDRLLLYVQD